PNSGWATGINPPYSHVKRTARTVSPIQLDSARSRLQRISRKAKIFNHLSPDQMLLNNPLGILRRHFLIPRAFGIDHRNRAVDADSQALAFRAVERAIG